MGPYTQNELRGPAGVSLRLRFDYLTAAQAGGADADMFRGRSHPGVNRPQVDIPAPLAHVVGVADGITELRPFAANVTNSCHNSRILPGCCRNTHFTGRRRISPRPKVKGVKGALPGKARAP